MDGYDLYSIWCNNKELYVYPDGHEWTQAEYALFDRWKIQVLDDIFTENPVTDLEMGIHLWIYNYDQIEVYYSLPKGTSIRYRIAVLVMGWMLSNFPRCIRGDYNYNRSVRYMNALLECYDNWNDGKLV